MTSRFNQVYFELNVPDIQMFTEPYMKPPPDSYLLDEILKEIKSIVNNGSHAKVDEYTQVSVKYRNLKCWLCVCLSLIILIAVGWAIYMFLVCKHITNGHSTCEHLDYRTNIVNHVCGGVLIVAVFVYIVMTIYSRCRYVSELHDIAHEWRMHVKEELQATLEERKQKSPQHVFVMKYERDASTRQGVLNGMVSIEKHAGNTPTKSNRSHAAVASGSGAGFPNTGPQSQHHHQLQHSNSNNNASNVQQLRVGVHHQSGVSSDHYQQMQTPQSVSGVSGGSGQHTPQSHHSQNSSRKVSKPMHSHKVSNAMIEEMQKDNVKLLKSLVNASSNGSQVSSQQQQQQQQQLQFQAPQPMPQSQAQVQGNMSPPQQRQAQLQAHVSSGSHHPQFSNNSSTSYDVQESTEDNLYAYPMPNNGYDATPQVNAAAAAAPVNGYAHNGGLVYGGFGGYAVNDMNAHQSGMNAQNAAHAVQYSNQNAAHVKGTMSGATNSTTISDIYGNYNQTSPVPIQIQQFSPSNAGGLAPVPAYNQPNSNAFPNPQI